MKKLLLCLAVGLNATTITNLFDAIKNTPDYKLDKIMVNEMKIDKDSIQSLLYPKITLTGSMEHFNRYNSMAPLTPIQSAEITKTGDSIPFSKNINKLGFSISMPIFIKEIYDNKKKMEVLLKASKISSNIEILKKDALIVIYVSKLNYLFSLKKALLNQKTSIQKSYDSLSVGVKVGRIPEFKLLRLKDSLNQIKIKISNINQNIDEIKSSIYKLTLLNIDKPIKFSSLEINKGEFISIKPIQLQLKASEYDIKSKKDSFYPKVNLKLQGNKSFGDAYNTNENIEENFASAGIYVSWDIFNKKSNSSIQKSKIEYLKESYKLAKLKKDLESEIVKIDSSLKEVNKQIGFIKESIKLKKELLKGAKVAFKLNRMSVDEYLKYEDDLTTAYANLADLIATKNQFKANKALIYGENFKRIFK